MKASPESIRTIDPHKPAEGSHSQYEATMGFNCKAHSNFVVQPEYGYQWSPALQNDEGIFGIDMIVTY